MERADRSIAFSKPSSRNPSNCPRSLSSRVSQFEKPSGSLLVPLMICKQMSGLISQNCASQAHNLLLYTHLCSRLDKSCVSEKDIA